MKKKIFIKILERRELPKFFKFIETKWKKNYIFNKNKKFFLWQFYNKKNKKYNFIIAKFNNHIVGCLGYIPNSIYSSNFINNDYLWLVNWVVDKKFNFISLSLINYLLNNVKYSFIGTLGCAKNTFNLLKILGFQSGHLVHLASKNDSFSNYKISNFKKNKNKISKHKNDYNVQKLNKKKISNFFKYISPINYKDEEYFTKRYLSHPVYKYNFYGIFKNELPKGFFVTRFCNFNKRTSLKLIDYHGNKINLLKAFTALDKILKFHSHEFLDLYINGGNNYFEGFSNFTVKKKTIVPNYFEPFQKKNITIRFAYHCKDINFNKFFVRGDCDQDRPN